MSNNRNAVDINNRLSRQSNLHWTIRHEAKSLCDFAFEFDRAQYFRDSLYSKYSDPDPAQFNLRRERAYEKLRGVEKRNRETSFRLKNSKGFVCGKSTSALIFTAKSYIARILGDFDLDELFVSADFSNGASISKRRGESTAKEKFIASSACSERALPYLQTLIHGGKLYHLMNSYGDKIEPINYNVLFTVPKNADIERIAAKEPDWNMYFQKGLGSMIRRRLRKNGIDLNNQSINRDYARLGSIDGSLATLDLSSASDSVTEELVYQLLPSDWFKHLSALRSPIGRFPDGTTHKWVLFSTMGNGYTFELESLIFYALAKAITYHFGVKGPVSVYGDDIIIPTAGSKALSHLLGFCGFIVNTDKSFTTGFFRESCGGHYYKGVDVTPVYIRGPLTLSTYITFLNRFRLWCSNGGQNDVLDPRHFPFWETLSSRITSDYPQLVGHPDSTQSFCLCAPGRASSRIKDVNKLKQVSSDTAFVYSLVHPSNGNSVLDSDTVSISLGKYKIRKRSKTEIYYSERHNLIRFPQEFCEVAVNSRG